MMTTQEAIKQLEYDRGMCLFNPSTGEEEPMNDDCRKSAEALEIAIEALKRDVPVKPIMMTTPRRTKFFEYYDWKCPICNCFLAYEEDGRHLILAHEKSRCSNCFQLIDWSNTDDT